MGALLSYCLVSGFFMLVLYLAYSLFLAREKQHSFNRCILLLIYLISFSMPVIISTAENFKVGAIAVPVSIENIEIEAAGVVYTAPPLWGTVMIWVYIAGIVVVALKTVCTWIMLWNVVHKGDRFHQEDYILVVTENEKYAPFSWMRYIVISRGDYENGCDAITVHELKHIKCRHWIDLLLAQLVCIVNWFNPVAWLIRDELMLVHEYQADMAVLDSGNDAQEYQMLLIKKAVGSRFPSLANSLNHSKLKKRITMMYKSKSGAGRKFKALALVPVLSLALCVVSVPAVRAVVSTISSSTISVDKVSENPEAQQTVSEVNGSVAPVSAPEVMPQYPGGEAAMFEALMHEVKYVDVPGVEGASGRAVIKFTVNALGETQDFEVMRSSGYEEYDNEAIRAIREGLTERWIPGTVNGSPVPVSYVIPITFRPK